MTTLVDRYLMDDDTKFKEYFRLSPYLFGMVLDAVKQDIDSISTTWIPKPISARIKLCVTLRHLATGETFRSLAFQYRIHHTTIGRIVNDCLIAIIRHFLLKAIPTPTTNLFNQSIDGFSHRWQPQTIFLFRIAIVFVFHIIQNVVRFHKIY